MAKNAVEVLMMSGLSRAALSGLVTACKRERAHDNAAVNGNANADQNYPKIRPRRAQAMRERKSMEEKGRDINISIVMEWETFSHKLGEAIGLCQMSLY